MKRIILFIIITLCSLIYSCNGDSGTSNSHSQDEDSTVQPQPDNDPLRPTRPSFTSVPEDKSVNVALSSPITINFSEPMNLSTINPNNVQLSVVSSGSSSRLPLILVSTNKDSTQFSFKPEITFTGDMKYQITLTNGVRTQTGKTVAGQFSFTTKAYATTLVSMINPAPDQINVNLQPIIKLLFTQKVTNVESATLILYEGSINGPQIPASIDKINADSFNLTPLNKLHAHTTYFVVITSEINSLNQAPLKRTMFKFTTGEEVKPEVALISPANLYSASIYNKIIVKFNEKVTNVNNSSIKFIKNNQIEFPIQITALDTNNSYQIALFDNQALELNTNYSISLTDAIQDLAGNKLTPTQFNFTTYKQKLTNILEINGDYPRLAIAPDQSLMLAYTQKDEKISVKVYDGESWSTLGKSGFVANSSRDSLQIAINPLTTWPAIAFGIYTSLQVWQYDGKQWDSLNIKTNHTSIREPAITFDLAGNLWVTYHNNGDSPANLSDIYQYNMQNNSWSATGNIAKRRFSLLITDPYSGKIFHGFPDNIGSQVSFSVFNGTRWVNPVFPILKYTSYFDLAFAPEGTLYLAFADYRDSSNNIVPAKITVMRINNNGYWEVVGKPRFNNLAVNEQAYKVKIAISSDGTPHIVYRRQLNKLNSMLIKVYSNIEMWSFINGSWQEFPSKIVDTEKIIDFDFVLDKHDVPYIAYSDYEEKLKVFRID